MRKVDATQVELGIEPKVLVAVQGEMLKCGSCRLEPNVREFGKECMRLWHLVPISLAGLRWMRRDMYVVTYLEVMLRRRVIGLGHNIKS